MNVSTRTSRHHFRSRALFAVLLLGATTVWADPPATRSVEVSFRDLDVSTASGAAKLYGRIQAAARNVCYFLGDVGSWRYCVRPTVDAAVAKVNNPLLTALHSGHRYPAVTALNK